MTEKNLIEPGLLEKEKNATKLRLKMLSSIGIKDDEELDKILHDEKFNIAKRLSNIPQFTQLANSNIKDILTPIPEKEKSQKLKEYEELQKMSSNDDNNLTLSTVMVNSTLSTNGVYMINKTGRTLYTTSGQPLYYKEVCVKFPSSGKIYMMRTDGSMGYEYLNSSDSADTNFRKFNEMHWKGYGHLSCRGSKVDLYDYNGNYFGWIDYEELVIGSNYYAASTNLLLMSIHYYSVYGSIYTFDGFVHPKLNVATSMDKLAVYGDPNLL